MKTEDDYVFLLCVSKIYSNRMTNVTKTYGRFCFKIKTKMLELKLGAKNNTEK